MSSTPVGAALTDLVVNVASDDLVSDRRVDEGWVCVVWDRLPPDDDLPLGLATAREAALFPHRIFGDLPSVRSTISVEDRTPIGQVMKQVNRAGAHAVAVIDSSGRFLGAATRESMLTMLGEIQREMLSESERLGRAVDEDRRLLADWARRLADFNEAASNLFNLREADASADLVFQQGIEALTALVHARYGAIGVLDETGKLERFLHVGLSPSEVAAIGNLPAGRGLLGVIIQEGALLRVEEIASDPRRAGLPEHHPLLRNLLGVPITAGGRTFGRVYLCDKADGLPFDDQDARVASAFARMIAVLLSTTREIARRLEAEGALRRKAQELSAVVETLNSFLSSGDENRARAVLLEKAIDLTGSEAGFVVGSSEDGVWRTHAELNFPWRLFGPPELSSRIAAAGPTQFEIGEPPDSLCLAAVPVGAGQAPSGLLAVAGKGPYSSDQLELLGELSYAAAVLEAHQSVRRHQRSLEERLARAQRLEAMGQLAGGVAHDFNNLLTVVLGCSELLLSDLPTGDHRREIAEDIRAAAERGAGLSGQLLAFARRQVMRPSVVDLNEVVGGVSGMLRRLAGEAFQVRLQLADKALPVVADPAQLEVALMNVVANARDAMPAGGTIDIRLSRDGEHGAIEVRDTGVGMDEATLRRVFEPFYTTKAGRGGTGLGLASAHGIVHQSGGDISLTSEIGRGSACHIRLPLLQDAVAPDERTPETTSPVPSGDETLLLVEDEDLVRETLARGLRRLGYRVLQADRPSEALKIARECAGSIDAVITDLVMPETTGAELAAELRLQMPDVAVLLISGYAPEASRENLPARAMSVQKPFTVGALALKLRELLDATASNAGRRAPPRGA